MDKAGGACPPPWARTRVTQALATTHSRSGVGCVPPLPGLDSFPGRKRRLPSAWLPGTREPHASRSLRHHSSAFTRGLMGSGGLTHFLCRKPVRGYLPASLPELSGWGSEGCYGFPRITEPGLGVSQQASLRAVQVAFLRWNVLSLGHLTAFLRLPGS